MKIYTLTIIRKYCRSPGTFLKSYFDIDNITTLVLLWVVITSLLSPPTLRLENPKYDCFWILVQYLSKGVSKEMPEVAGG